MGIAPLKPAVFLDRDGVVNEMLAEGNAFFPPRTLEEFRFLPGVREACERLSGSGYLLVVVTNQPDVARGLQDKETSETMRREILRRLPVREVLACYHDDFDGCDCRKPKAGLLFQAAGKWRIDLKHSYMVGDRWKDVEAGHGAGCKSILIERDYSERGRCHPDFIARDLAEAARWILEKR